MRKLNVPFNISLLHLSSERIKNVKQVKALDIFDGATTNFHPEGLFSTEIFGRVGDERRSLIFGYIDIKAPIFHPLIFMAFTKLKRVYGEIMGSRAWALWDDSKKDFIKAKPSEGARTGYAFFLEHWRDIVFEESGSNIRTEYIKLIEKSKDIALTRYIVTMPAGLRDIEIDELNRKSEDEINTLYRKFIALSNVIIESSLVLNPEVIDKPRYDMQLNFASLYDMIEAMIAGKKKLFLGKVASRSIFNGTRNVITAMNTSVPILGKKGSIGFNSTIIGLYQYLQATLPVSCAQIASFLSAMFPDVNSPANLVDPKTWQPREVFLHVRYYDKWATTEGIEKIISSFKEEEIRKSPLMVDGYYLGLLYLGPDGTFKVFNDITQLPPARSREHVRPLTLTDIFFLSVYKHFAKYPLYVTRYPVTGVGSIYPSKTHLRVTVDYEERRMLDDTWIDSGEDNVAYEFPILESAFTNAMTPHTSHIARMGADFDGDTASGNCAYSDEAIAEAKKFFTRRKAYIGTNGKLLYSCAVDTIELVLHSMTGDPVKPALEDFSLMASLENYHEETSSSFTHWGIKYSLNDVFDMSHSIKPEPVSMKLLEWCVIDTKGLDPQRLAKADTNIPLIAVREKNKIYVLDGNHRLRKLYDEQAEKAMVKFINQDILDAARV